MIRRKFILSFLCVFCAYFLSGCSSLGTYNPATGRKELIFVPTDMEVDMGNESHASIIKQYPLSTDQAKISRLQRVGRRVAQVSDRQDYQYQFFLLESKDINAFTTPGGRIYILSALQDKLATDDDELAAVLAHEIGHCAARHIVKKFQAALGYDFVSNIIFAQVEMSDFARQVASLSSDSLITLVFSAYSRQDEYEADKLALKYLRLSGYGQQGMLRVLEMLERESQDSKIPLILRTHPYVSDRIKAVRREIDGGNTASPSGMAGGLR